MIFGGGSSSPSQPEPLIFNRQAHAQRHALHGVGPLLDHPPRAGRDPRRPHREPLSNALPLSDLPPTSTPASCEMLHPRRVFGDRYNGFDTWDYEYYYIGSVGQKFKQINYAVNPWSGLQVQSLDVAYLPDDGPPGLAQQNGDGYHPPRRAVVLRRRGTTT